MKKGIIYTVAGAMALAAGQAHALQLAAKTEAQAIRADISKQTQGFTACVVKANLACEASGVWNVQECNLNTGTANPPGDAKGKFADAIAKCESKVNYLKKNKTYTDAGAYEAIGCPGDSVPNCTAPNTPPGCQDGNQRYTNMTTYAANAKASAKSSVALLGGVLPNFLPQCADDTKCVAGYAGNLVKWTVAVQKCLSDCENDYAGKKGNGGNEDVNPSVNCSLDTVTGSNGAVGSDPVFAACVAKAYAGLTKKGPAPGVNWGLGGLVGCPSCTDLTGYIANVLTGANNGLYNSPSNCN